MKRKNSPKTNLENELKNSIVLITGGAGSIGTGLVKEILKYSVKSVRVLDIDEHALFRLKRSISDQRLRPLLGSILDKDRIEMATNGADIISHVAAVKNIEISEYNPIETIDVNINGTVNLIKTAMKNKPKKFITISTDKAAEPRTLYGSTKQLTEKLTSWAGTYLKPTKFATIRFGNVIESRGNVFEVWDEEMKSSKPLSITDPLMNRYFFHLDDAVNFILQCIPLIKNGEIFVPKMQSYNIKKLALKYSKKYKIIGKRPGEKIEEILITSDEKKIAVEKKDMWIIKPKFM